MRVYGPQASRYYAWAKYGVFGVFVTMFLHHIFAGVGEIQLLWPLAAVQPHAAVQRSTHFWIPDFSCGRSYSEEQLDSVQQIYQSKRCKNLQEKENPLVNCGLTLHTCSKDVMSQNNMSQPIALRWNQYTHEQTEDIWREVYNLMENNTLILIGDSMMFSTMTAIVMYLEDIGNRFLSNVDGHHSVFRYENGFQIKRPFYYNVTDIQEEELANQDAVMIVNAGLHYGTKSCLDGNPVCRDVTRFFSEVQEQSPGLRIAWLETFRPHFPNPDGSYINFKYRAHDQKGMCGPLDKSLREKSVIDGLDEPTVQLLSNSQVPVIRVNDISFDRYDLHLGLLTHFGDKEKLDCVHTCMQPCYWEPVVHRIGAKVLQMLRV